jgi:hypothetical protein
MILNIVGAGLAGSLVARQAGQEGLRYRLFDDGRFGGASRYSENLLSPTWLRDQAWLQPALTILTRLVPVRPLSFWTGTKQQLVYFAPLADTLLEPEIRRSVTAVTDEGVTDDAGEQYAGPTVIATGVWARALVPSLPEIENYAGHALLFPGSWGQPIMRCFQPYRHEKIFEWQPGVTWYGDSTAVPYARYTREREQLVAASRQRARAAGLLGEGTLVTGYRPSVGKRHGGYTQRVSERVWTITGGYKNGLVCYAMQAPKLIHEIQVCGL